MPDFWFLASAYCRERRATYLASFVACEDCGETFRPALGAPRPRCPRCADAAAVAWRAAREPWASLAAVANALDCRAEAEHLRLHGRTRKGLPALTWGAVDECDDFREAMYFDEPESWPVTRAYARRYADYRTEEMYHGRT
jgi:hypothetical protein